MKELENNKPSEIKGYIHSFQSLGAVDGPGVRYVVFMQGCPYRCPYCHNPDTRIFSGGKEYFPGDIVKTALRYKPYFTNGGGVTVSGGEPLVQKEFVAGLFEKLHENGINTALDTAAVKPDETVRRVIRSTDTVLCDIKFPTDEMYGRYIGQSLDNVLEFLSVCDESGADIIIRHVVVPGLTDSEKSVKEISRLANSVCCPKKIELLPFRKLCVEKYRKLGIPFPLEHTPECTEETVVRLERVL